MLSADPHCKSRLKRSAHDDKTVHVLPESIDGLLTIVVLRVALIEEHRVRLHALAALFAEWYVVLLIFYVF